MFNNLKKMRERKSRQNTHFINTKIFLHLITIFYLLFGSYSLRNLSKKGLESGLGRVSSKNSIP